MYRILIIEDDRAACGAVHRVLQSLGHDVVAVDASAAAMTLLVEQTFDVVISGLEPRADVARDVGTLAIPEHLAGLPLSIDAVVEPVTEIENRTAFRQTLERARTLIEDAAPGSPIIGRSPAMRLGRVAAVTGSNASVLVTGESGHRQEADGAGRQPLTSCSL